jgi:hypothetical protein
VTGRSPVLQFGPQSALYSKVISHRCSRHISLHYTKLEMAEPPSYEESTSGDRKSTERKGDSKAPQPWNIREQVGLSRSQHVASIVAQIGGHIQKRALQGLSKTTMVLIPSDQSKSIQENRARQVLTQYEVQAARVQSWGSQTMRCQRSSSSRAVRMAHNSGNRTRCCPN